MNTTPSTFRTYRVLTHGEREEIMIGIRTEKSIREIARELGRHPSVILREINNNKTEDGRYQAYWAQQRSNRRRQESRKRERIADEEIREYLQEKLELGWSPEQIAGRIGRDFPGKSVSHETIYQYIFKKDRSLTQYLVCGRKNRRKRIQKRGKRVMIANRVGIEERPDEANRRTERGHWEGDTAISRKSKTALMVLHERKHGITLLQKMPRCAPREMKEAVCARLGSLPPKWRKTLTMDNGQENRFHADIQKELKLQTYFCNPYSSWEKGSVENSVGLTRRVWPKKSDYALLSDEDIAMVEYRLNTRPRKRLGYLNPYEHAKSVAFTP